MLDIKLVCRAAALAVTLGAAAGAGAETATYTGSGNYVADQDLMPLASGDAVVLGTAQGTVAMSTEPPSLMEVRCSGMGIAKHGGDYGSVLYCAFIDAVDKQHGLDIKGIEREGSTALEVVGGSGRWAGASGTGTLERIREWSNGGAIRFELSVTTP